MNIFKRSNKLSFACFLLMLTILLGGAFINPSHADNLDNVIDFIDIKYGENGGPINKGEKFSIYADWSLKDENTKSGDTFQIKFPEELNIDGLRMNLPLMADNNEIYAIGRIDKEERTLTFTFNDIVEKKINVKGYFEIYGFELNIDNPNNNEGVEGKNITINSGVDHNINIEYDNGSYNKDPSDYDKNEFDKDRSKNFEKLGVARDEDMYWHVYVNANKKEERTSKPIKVFDKLGPGHTINRENFRLIIREHSNDSSNDKDIDLSKYFKDNQTSITEEIIDDGQEETNDNEVAIDDSQTETSDDEVAIDDNQTETSDYEVAIDDSQTGTSDDEVAIDDSQTETSDDEVAIDDSQTETSDDEVPTDDSQTETSDDEETLDDSQTETSDDEVPTDDNQAETSDDEETLDDYIKDFTFSDDNKSYSLTFNPGKDKKALIIYYHTEVDEDADPTQYIFENKVKISVDDEKDFETTIPEEVEYYKMFGYAQGENPKGSFEVIKVDEENNPIRQEGATFRLIKNSSIDYDGSEKELTASTNEDGIAVFKNVESGKYILEEIKAPEGYSLDTKSKPIMINFKNNSNGKIEYKFINKPVEKTEYKIHKKWDIPEGIDINQLDSLDEEYLKAQFELYKIVLEYDENGELISENNTPITHEIKVEDSIQTISLKDKDKDIVWSNLDKTNQYGHNIRYIAKESMDDSIFELSIKEDRYSNPIFINKLKMEPLIPNKPEDKEKPEPKDPVEPLIPEDPYEPGQPTDPNIPEDHPINDEINDPEEIKESENSIIPENKEVSSHIEIDDDFEDEYDEDIEVAMLNDTIIDNSFETTSKDEEGPIDILPQTGEKFRYPYYLLGLLFLVLGVKLRKEN